MAQSDFRELLPSADKIYVVQVILSLLVTLLIVTIVV